MGRPNDFHKLARDLAIDARNKKPRDKELRRRILEFQDTVWKGGATMDRLLSMLQWIHLIFCPGSRSWSWHGLSH